jgi:hypothetical protein
MKSCCLLVSVFIISSQIYGYTAKIVNHTPWQLNGRPTRAWIKMDNLVIKPHATATWNSGVALITGITLDLVIDQNNVIKEVLKEDYAGRAVNTTYHVFAEPFLNNKQSINTIKLRLIREPAGGIKKTTYPGGIVKESKEIDLTTISSPKTRIVPTVQATAQD